MLRENTGSHFLDSGGIYGYQYNRPIRKATFYPATYGRVTEWHLINTAHWLTANLDYDAILTRSLKHLGLSPEFKHEPWEDCMQEWVERNGYKVVAHGYTYNDENNLDRDFAWWTIETPGDWENRVIIRSHNGCDARGGFSSPRVFRPLEDNEWKYGPYGMTLEYYCPNCQHYCSDECKGRVIRAGMRCECGHIAHPDCSGMY